MQDRVHTCYILTFCIIMHNWGKAYKLSALLRIQNVLKALKWPQLAVFPPPPSPLHALACSFIICERENLCSESGLSWPGGKLMGQLIPLLPFLSSFCPPPISYLLSAPFLNVCPASICRQLQFYSSPVVFVHYFHLQKTTNGAADTRD